MMAPSSSPAPSDECDLDLQAFLPYKLAVLAEQVSRTLSQIYSDRFDLTRHEWRVLAALANCGQIAAKDVSDYTTLDKMAISRAVATLESKGYLTREEDQNDRRNKILHTTPVGRTLYQKIAPLALAREEYLLSPLTQDDRQALDRIMTTLLERAKVLESLG